MINKGKNNLNNSLNILVVDDNLMIQHIIGMIFESTDCHPDIVSDGVRALEALEKKSYDLILMDLQMPEMNGFETTAHIRARELATGKHIPILAMTGYHLENGRQKCIDAGMEDYLEKPFNIAELFETIESLTHYKLCANDY